eukprot:TRINITY_DN12089_c0_g1_i1.p1 TRINITY_DN12089_c0_g1~~TRINITY_DN12089_c0_g1_i1.p1  ORF type:complete len:493 (+),score=139.53 TRINITY_DN12089_c0_g1_i1:79-1557(+)
MEDIVQEAQGPSVWVANLPQHINAEKVMAAFGLRSCPKIINTPKTQSTAVAQITTQDEEAAWSFATEWNDTSHIGLDSRVLSCSVTLEGLAAVEGAVRKQREGTQVYICHIPHLTRSHNINDFFGTMKDRILESRYFTYKEIGVGSAWFCSNASAEDAASSYDGATFEHFKMAASGKVLRMATVVMCDLDLDNLVQRHMKATGKKEVKTLTVGTSVVSLKQLGVAGFGKSDAKGSTGVVTQVLKNGKVEVEMESGSLYDVGVEWLEVGEGQEEQQEDAEQKEPEGHLSTDAMEDAGSYADDDEDPGTPPLAVTIAAGARPPGASMLRAAGLPPMYPYSMADPLWYTGFTAGQPHVAQAAYLKYLQHHHQQHLKATSPFPHQYPPLPGYQNGLPAGSPNVFSGNSVVATGLPLPCGEKDVASYFSRAGPVCSVVISRNGKNSQNTNTKQGPGKAVITYFAYENARSAVLMLNETSYKSCLLSVYPYAPFDPSG